jgi:CheY-like chemotaxis protein
LNGVLGMAQLLLMPDLAEEERHEYARTILNSGQTLLTLLNDILDLSKVEAGKLKLTRAVFDPRHLLEETTLLFAQLAQSKGLSIETAWHGPQDHRYRADPGRLRQMLANLIGNALKFTPQGFVRVEATELEYAEGKALLEFSVTDSGIGIPPDKQTLLFQPFTQVDSSTTREYGGTGLGLSIIRSLARLMEGDVGLTSEAGKGSRFWFRIRAEVLREGEESRHVERDVGIEHPPKTAIERTETILVVEDNPVNRKVVKAMLGKLGFRAESVDNGQEAVDALTRGMPRPGLVLMDMQMPVMDGITATEHIRQREKETHQPRLTIVALTAGAFEEDRQRCIAAGMDDFLTKPVNVNDLAAVLAKWMDASP